MIRTAAPTVLLLLVLLSGGCATTIIPPPPPADPAIVYVTNYGRHSSLLLPESNDQWIEYAFGDWGWFAKNQKNSSSALHAMLFSKDSTLGRREVTLPENASDEAIARVIGAKTADHIVVPRVRADALRQKLDAIHQAHIETVVFNSYTQLWFVKYDGGYGVCHNCNHATAAWLRDLGCTIRGSAMFSKFRVEQQTDR